VTGPARGSQTGHSGSSSLYYGQNEGADGGGNHDTGVPERGCRDFAVARFIGPAAARHAHVSIISSRRNSGRTGITPRWRFQRTAARATPSSRPRNGSISRTTQVANWLSEAVDLTSFCQQQWRRPCDFTSTRLMARETITKGWFIDDVCGQRPGRFALPIVPLTRRRHSSMEHGAGAVTRIGAGDERVRDR